jgi:hypothetical protein
VQLLIALAILIPLKLQHELILRIAKRRIRH